MLDRQSAGRSRTTGCKFCGKRVQYTWREKQILAFVDKDSLARYLLGELSPDDHQRLEKECLADDEVWEELNAVENDLIDSYVRGDLPEHQRREFEQYFLDSPEKQERVETAKLLMDATIRKSIATTPVEGHRQPRTWRMSIADVLAGRHRTMKLALGAAAASGVAIAVLVAFLVLENRHLQAELERLQLQQVALQRQVEQLEQRPNIRSSGENTAANNTDQLATVSAFLAPGLQRETGQRNTSGVLRIPASASSVLLMLDLQRDEYRKYHVVIETPEGNRVSRADGLTSQAGKTGGRIISMRLPSQALTKGDYVITLSGLKASGDMEVVDSYALSVVR